MTALEGLKEEAQFHPQPNYTMSTSGMWYSSISVGSLLIVMNRLRADACSSSGEPQKYVQLDEQRQLSYFVK